MSSDELDSRGTEVVAFAGPSWGPLLSELGIETVERPREDAFLLLEAEGQLELRPPGALGRPGIRAVLPPERSTRSARDHPLVRAFGRDAQHVLDLTAGLGGDAYRLAAAGHRVDGCERHRVVFALLTSGWAAARARGRVPDEIADRLAFVRAEAHALMAGASPRASLAIYLDPMYPPPRRASALPRREIQLLRRLVGADEGDDSALLAEARARAARVVVKRPSHAPPLAPDVSHAVESKLVRFDVYFDARAKGSRAV